MKTLNVSLTFVYRKLCESPAVSPPVTSTRTDYVLEAEGSDFVIEHNLGDLQLDLIDGKLTVIAEEVCFYSNFCISRF